MALLKLNRKKEIGVKIATINERQPFIYLSRPFLTEEGKPLKLAIDKYQKLVAASGDAGAPEAEELQASCLVEIIVESLKQQYSLIDETQTWEDVVKSFFLDGDLIRAFLSLQVEKEISFSTMAENASGLQSLFLQEKKV